jgi:CDK inhibitor PHO81
VTLEIGGGVETYWKSTAIPAVVQTVKPMSSLSSAIIGSAATSPSNYGMSPAGQATTVSSVIGSYIHAVVQLTRDGHPIIYAGRRLPEDAFDLSISDVTLPQLEALARRHSKWVEFWSATQTALPYDCVITLDALLKVIRIFPRVLDC